MVAEIRRFSGQELTVGREQMLVGVPLDEDGREVVRYLTVEADGDAVEDEGVKQALSVIGAWSDLDWDQALDEFDRIRHANRPTPLVEDL